MLRSLYACFEFDFFTSVNYSFFFFLTAYIQNLLDSNHGSENQIGSVIFTSWTRNKFLNWSIQCIKIENLKINIKIIWTVKNLWTSVTSLWIYIFFLVNFLNNRIYDYSMVEDPTHCKLIFELPRFKHG